MNTLITNHLICLFNCSLLIKKKIINVPFSNEAFYFIYMLYIENYLDYVFVKENRIFFKIKYSKGHPTMKKINFFSKKGQKKIISFKSFWDAFQFFHKQTVFYTGRRLIPDYIIKKIKSGGQAFFIILI